MRQLYLLILVLAPLLSLAQKQKPPGFIMVAGGMFKPESYRPYTVLSFGISKPDGFGIGGGLGYYDIKSAYIPVYASVNYTGKEGKLAPMFLANLGYGAYGNTSNDVRTIGGLYIKFNAGIAFPLGATKSKTFVNAGITIMQFTSKHESSETQTTAAQGIFNVGIGIKFSHKPKK